MDVRGSLAGAWLALCALAGCTGQAGIEASPEEPPPREAPLAIQVDTLEVVHGALRVEATMVDGAADVAVTLGGRCEHREVGGGVSTPSLMIWSLGDGDVGEAIRCGLTVRARARDALGAVTKVADLGVDVSMQAEGDNADDAPQLQAVTMADDGIAVDFSAVTPAARLTTGDSILAAAAGDAGGGETPADGSSARFVVPRLDFARSVLRGRALSIDGAAFATSLSVGGMGVETEPVEVEEATEDESEEVVE